MQSKKVLIGVPMHKGEMSTQTNHSLMLGSSDLHQVDCYPLGLSLLAKNFNLQWIQAYQKGYDFYVCHHSDLGCVGTLSGYEGTWLDLLVERITDLQAAALSAVIPIKSDAGLTSTALELQPGNPYSLRRLTMKELSRCPLDFINREDLCETFGLKGEDVGAFLINTGLLIIDLRNFDWCGRKWPGFNIQDTIEWNTTGRPQSYTIPEDWYFSRWLHYEAPDWPYFATRELIVAHAGGRVFMNNSYDYGQPHDNPIVQKSIEEYRQT